MMRDSVEGKPELAAMLDDKKRYVQYFAVVALAHIGDAQSRSILYRWAKDHAADQKELAIIVAVRLIWMNDFRLLHLMAAADPANGFVMGTIISMGREKLGMVDMTMSNDSKGNAQHLKRIMEFLSEIPPEVRDTLR